MKLQGKFEDFLTVSGLLNACKPSKEVLIKKDSQKSSVHQGPGLMRFEIPKKTPRFSQFESSFLWILVHFKVFYKEASKDPNYINMESFT